MDPITVKVETTDEVTGEQLCRTALAEVEESYPLGHKKWMQAVIRLAVFLVRAIRVSEAEQELARAWPYLELPAMADSPERAAALYAKGCIHYSKLESALSAEHYFLEAARIFRLHPNLPYEPRNLGQLALFYATEKQFEKAEAYVRQAEECYAQPVHSYLPAPMWQLYHHMAGLYKEKGDLPEAEKYYWRAFQDLNPHEDAFCEKAYALFFDLGQYLYSELRFEEAEVLVGRAVANKEKYSGQQSKELIEPMGILAEVVAGLDKIEQAEQICLRCEEIIDTDNEVSAECVNNTWRTLSFTRWAQGHFADSREYSLRLIESKAKHATREDPCFSRDKRDLSATMVELGFLDEAERLVQETIIPELNKEDNSIAHVELGSIRARQQRFDEALSFYQIGLEGCGELSDIHFTNRAFGPAFRSLCEQVQNTAFVNEMAHLCQRTLIRWLEKVDKNSVSRVIFDSVLDLHDVLGEMMKWNPELLTEDGRFMPLIRGVREVANLNRNDYRYYERPRQTRVVYWSLNIAAYAEQEGWPNEIDSILEYPIELMLTWPKDRQLSDLRTRKLLERFTQLMTRSIANSSADHEKQRKRDILNQLSPENR